jgi:hypothetical protein
MIFRWLPAAATLALAGCAVNGSEWEHEGPSRHEFHTIARDSTRRLRVNLNMAVGDLETGAGADKLMTADFTYATPSWKPVINYSTSDGQGDLTIRQPREPGVPHVGHHNYDWDVRLARDIPTNLSVHFGAGKARLDLGHLNLEGVDVEMGVGELNLDLRGNPRRDYDVRIRGGVGQATVQLPADAGVVADVEGGIGSVDAPGLVRHGNRFENEAYGRAKTTIHLNIHGGIGQIRLLAE